jgi:DNA-directed RNA polymerase subunit beta
MITQSNFFFSDFLDIQRKSFQDLLKTGLIEEFRRRNPITESNVEIFFYPQFYKLTSPENTTREAIMKGESYSSRLLIPVQFTNKKTKHILLKWVLIGHFPLMTKRGFFILNGAPRVIVNQLIRSPGLYFQEKKISLYISGKDEKPLATIKRYYADFICLRGTWLRIEIDKDRDIWAQFKKGPKIPLLWLLHAMGYNQAILFKCISNPLRLFANFETKDLQEQTKISPEQKKDLEDELPKFISSPEEAWYEIAELFQLQRNRPTRYKIQQGRKWIYNKFLNPRNYDLGKEGRNSLNRKLGLKVSLSQTTLTPKDLLYGTDYLLKIEKGQKNIDDIDHLMNRKIRTAGELIQMQIGIGLVRLEKNICDNLKSQLNQSDEQLIEPIEQSTVSNQRLFSVDEQFREGEEQFIESEKLLTESNQHKIELQGEREQVIEPKFKSKTSNMNSDHNKSTDFFLSLYLSKKAKKGSFFKRKKKETFYTNKNRVGDLTNFERICRHLIHPKIFDDALREFFGTNPLSQFMDQTNPLSEITHKRRLSSMGPGGVDRENAPMAIRSIHPTHYGRICPIETPEGKNTGLVNSLTTCARVTSKGFIETPFYKVFKGQVQKNIGIFFLNTEQEDKIKSAPSDLSISTVGFLPKSKIPIRLATEFTNIQRNEVEFIGVSPMQMISVATSLIPFLEHDDANRALMGSNMQRQAVPLIRPERPIVGTGLEARAACDSGHVLQSRYSGFVGYVSADKIIVYITERLLTKI